MEAANRRIAKNTLLLYARTVVTMVANLFTSRLVIQALGVEDYGIYGAVGSIVAMSTIVNGSLSAGTSRFLAFDLGRGDPSALNKTFNASLAMHALLSVAIVVLLETVCVWFVNGHMNIPAGRALAANVVLQASIASCALSMTQVPYGAAIIARERMDVYAYLGLADAAFGLALGLGLRWSPFADGLILYAAAMAAWSIAKMTALRVYCRRRFPETRLRLCRERGVYTKMLSFSAWDTVGAFCSTGNSQGVNILINIFFGVAVNAARAVAYQVEHAATFLMTNFVVAVNPQIVKSYAAGDKRRFFGLIVETGRLSFFLALLVALPLWLEADTVLSLWLVDVPAGAGVFTRFVLGIATFRVLARTTIMGVHATGDVKTLNLTSGVYSTASFLPLVFVAYWAGMPAWSSFVVQSFNAVVCTFFEARSLWLNERFSVRRYAVRLFAQPIGVAALAALAPSLVAVLLPPGAWRLVGTCAASTLSLSASAFFMLLSPTDRGKVLAYAKRHLPFRQ